MTKLSLAFCLLAAYLLTWIALPTELKAYQTKRHAAQPNQRRGSSNGAGYSYSSEPFDLNVGKLPPNYRGHDIVACYNRLKKAAVEKGEFETTAQYVGRINSLAADYLYAFRVEPKYVGSLSFGLDYTYDADRALLSANLQMDLVSLGLVSEYEKARSTLRITTTHGTSDKDFSITERINDGPPHEVQYTATGVRVREGRATRDSYVGSNAYGARKRVARFVTEDYNIAFGKERLHAFLALQLPARVSPEVARTLKPRLGVLLICNLTPFPYAPLLVFDYYRFLDPTLDSPIDSFNTKKYIHTKLRAIWVYDTLTGEVLAKHAPQ